MELRENIKSVEFKAEHLQEDTLQALSGQIPESSLDTSDQISAASNNIRRYLQELGVPIQGQVALHLIKIVCAAFPAAPEEEIKNLII